MGYNPNKTDCLFLECIINTTTTTTTSNNNNKQQQQQATTTSKMTTITESTEMIIDVEDGLQRERDEEDLPLREEIDMSIFGRKEYGMMDDDEINELFGGEIYGDNVDSSMMLNLYMHEDYYEEQNYPEFVDIEDGAMHNKVSILLCQDRKLNVVIDLAYRTHEGSRNHQFIITMWFNDVLVYRNVFGEVKRGYLKKGLMYDIIQHNKAYIEKQRIRNECSKTYCVVVDKFVSGNTNLNNDCISIVMNYVC